MLQIMFSLPVWISSLLFAVVHSLFASERCKRLFCRHNISLHRYRLCYSISALPLTCLWLFYIHQLPDTPLYRVEGWQNGLMIAAQLLGLWIALYSFKSFDTSLFLGLKNSHGEPEPFHEHGIYHYIRHPMYSGIMLALLASPIHTVNSLNLTICISLYFIIGSRLEEGRMIKSHPEYLEYRQRVPAFLPWRALFRRHSGS